MEFNSSANALVDRGISGSSSSIRRGCFCARFEINYSAGWPGGARSCQARGSPGLIWTARA